MTTGWGAVTTGCETAVVVFTRDPRVHDNPVLALAGAEFAQVVPMFVVDPALAVPPNRRRFLADDVSGYARKSRDSRARKRVERLA